MSPNKTNEDVPPILRTIFPGWTEEQLSLATEELTRFLGLLYDDQIQEKCYVRRIPRANNP